MGFDKKKSHKCLTFFIAKKGCTIFALSQKVSLCFCEIWHKYFHEIFKSKNVHFVFAKDLVNETVYGVGLGVGVFKKK